MTDRTVAVKRLCAKLHSRTTNSYITNREWFVPFLCTMGVQPFNKGDYVLDNATLIMENYEQEFEDYVRDIMEIYDEFE